MRINKSAFLYTESVLSTILLNMTQVSKPMKKFIFRMVPVWWSISGKYNFMNVSRYCNYCEQTIRNVFERGFNFFRFNNILIEKHCGKNRILVFDPSHLSKSGKHTPGLGKFWSGTAQRPLKGLEIGCLSCIDVDSETAFHLEAIQTPNTKERKGKSLIEFYATSLKTRVTDLSNISRHLVVDGYFMKKEFIKPITEMGMEIITKMRTDANLYYRVRREDQPKGRGRPRVKGKKINMHKIDKRKWSFVERVEGVEIYTIIAYCMTLKKTARIIYILNTQTGNYEILLSTDENLNALTILNYYRLRFQIEFLIRDAKQHAGLEECQARSKKKLYFHFNMSMTSVTVAKTSYYLSIPAELRTSFSMESIKRLYHNKILAEFIFANLDLNLNCNKIKKLYYDCLSFGSMAA